MTDLELQEANATLEAAPLNGTELTDEEMENLFKQTPEDQGLTEDGTLPF